MPLKAVSPETKDKRLKLFLFGPAGVGKTTSAIQFPDSYILDTEKGTDFYAKTIKKSRSVVFQSNNSDEIRDEIRELLTTKHSYRTLIIDPVTQIYNAIQEKWTRIFEKHAKTEKEAEVQDFGMRYWGKVKGEFKAIQRMLVALDMNVIVLSHQKDMYGTGMQKLGVTFDSMKGEDYLYDLVFRLDLVNNKRMAIKIKERAEIGHPKFPDEFEWSYDNFLKFYGQEVIERESTPVILATADQVSKIKKLLEVVKTDESEVQKWFTKADVDSWEEMTNETARKCLDYLEKKLGGLNVHTGKAA